ncbi:MAG: thymidine phosphorylase [Cyanobacteria bacterium REEB65]|nr:thymidine phosphorylase [Cyanobacteria bacterium REEB65]
MPDILDLIRAKRNGHAHSAEAIGWLIDHLGTLPDYQLAAWLMAVCCQGMTEDETTWLTDAMARSGDLLDLSEVPGPRVDKHSTGGVGDKVSLVLAPLISACGGTMAKLSGRGLGHTGGTIDKLESFRGFTADLSPEAFKAQLRRIGVALAGQSARLAPADGQLYALRDVTGTIESAPLICASILSKKIAAGADVILLDVKTGAGAFMPTEQAAAELASLMQRVGRRLGRTVVCVVSEMGQPLGRAVGNAIEVQEAIETLHGRGPGDLRELCLSLGALLLEAGGLAPDPRAARDRLEAAIADGSALAKMRELVAAQGGDAQMVDHPDRLPAVDHEDMLVARISGYIENIDARRVGEAACSLGAGRKRKGDPLDLGAGVFLHAKVGDRIDSGEPIATLRFSDPRRLPEARAHLEAAYRIGTDPTSAPELVKRVFAQLAPEPAR